MRIENIDIPDFHSHIIPRIDHGSDSLETSIKQLQFAQKYGVTRVLATPHFYPNAHTLDSYLERRDAFLKELITNSEGLPAIKVGTEVLLCEGIEKLPGIEKLCFKGTNHLLLELPFIDFKNEYVRSVENLIKAGINVILAHADRYPKSNIETLIDHGVENIQLNAPSLLRLNKFAYSDWFKRGLLVGIGSDIHGPDKSAYKKFEKAKNNLSNNLSIVKEKSDMIWDSIAKF